MKVKKNKGFSLFATPNFLSGLSRIFDISSTINVYNNLQSPEETNFRALQSDRIYCRRLHEIFNKGVLII